MVTKNQTTAIVAANEAPDANHQNETVTVTNSGDEPATDGAANGTPVSAIEAASQPAEIAPATTVDPSGAPVQVVADVDMSNPAVDDNPRAGTTIAQNKIDFNDPTLSGPEAVAKMLNAQGIETKTEGDK